MTDNLSKNLAEIKNINLLKSLESKELEALLSDAKINDYKKDKIIFSANEKITNFYILLEGSLKIFAINYDGEESTLQLIKSGESIFNIFENIFPANVQAVEDCKVLAISLKKIREFSQKNSGFIKNLLQEAAQKNNELLKQITNLKMTDADYKIGQFLLGIAFEKGDKAKDVELKLNKSTIASYLGIKPETLSRSLKRLKELGEISVDKNKITFLKKDSLCNYCDAENSKKCSNRKSSFCIHD